MGELADAMARRADQVRNQLRGPIDIAVQALIAAGVAPHDIRIEVMGEATVVGGVDPSASRKGAHDGA